MPTSYKFRIWQSEANNQWYWSLDARNGESVAIGGEGFSSRSSCTNSIQLVKENAKEAEIEEVDDPNASK